jgi:hypothetical protein
MYILSIGVQQRESRESACRGCVDGMKREREQSREKKENKRERERKREK